MKLKKKLLTAAICLALSTGHALAMPAGGQIVTGDNISGFVPNPESGATITFGGNGVINWDAFNIGANESLTFDVVKDALAFNYVSGADISTILGHLTQSGEGGMLLCNPNGIVVGNGAVINANDFTMMTMKLTDDQLKNIFEAGGSDILMTAGKDKAGNPALIDIQSGANFKITDKINLYGGRVAIADGVVISSEPDTQNGGIKNDDIHIFAGNEMQIENGEGGPDLIKFSADKNNTINVGKVDLTANDNVSLIGGSVSLDGTSVSTKTFDAHAMSGLEYRNYSKEGVYNKDNVVSVNNANIREVIADKSTGAASGEITGGTVNISNSVIGSDSENGGMYIGALADDGALKISDSDMAMGDLTLVALDGAKPSNHYTQGNNIEIQNSSIDVGSSFDAHGYRIDISNKSNISAKYGMLWAASDETYNESTGNMDYHASADNEVNISNSKLSFESGFAGYDAKYDVNKLSVRGGKISVNNSEITNTGEIYLKSYNDANKGNITISNSNISVTGEDVVDQDGGYENIAIWSQGGIVLKDSMIHSNDFASVIATENIDDYLTYGADNKIAISGSSITAPGKMRIYGSSIDVMNGSVVESGNHLTIEAKAEEIKGGTADNIEYVTKANADNVLNVTADSKIKSGYLVDLLAGRATIAGHLYNTKTEEEPFEYDKAVGKITILADSSSVSDPEPVLPEIPDVPVTPDVPVAPIEGLDKITEDTPMDEIAEVIQKQVNTPAQADKAISQVVELNISNEKKAEVVRTIIENVEVSAEADTHVQNMSAAAQRDGGTSVASVETVNAGSEVAGAGAAADVSVDGVEVQE